MSAAFAPSDLRILFRDPSLLPDRVALDNDCRACGRATWGESDFCPRMPRSRSTCPCRRPGRDPGAAPTAHAASAVSRIPTRTEIRHCVLRGVAAKTLSKDVVAHMLATRPSIPTNLNLDTVLQRLKALECADTVLEEEGEGDVRTALCDLHLMLSEILSGVTGKPRYNLRTGCFERKQPVIVNQFGDTRLQWVPVNV